MQCRLFIRVCRSYSSGTLCGQVLNYLNMMVQVLIFFEHKSLPLYTELHTSVKDWLPAAQIIKSLFLPVFIHINKAMGRLGYAAYASP
jgi:hypothetical protein